MSTLVKTVKFNRPALLPWRSLNFLNSVDMKRLGISSTPTTWKELGYPQFRWQKKSGYPQHEGSWDILGFTWLKFEYPSFVYKAEFELCWYSGTLDISNMMTWKISAWFTRWKLQYPKCWEYWILDNPADKAL